MTPFSAAIGQHPGFVDDLPRRAAAFRSAGEWNDAKGAELVAAALHAHVGLQHVAAGLRVAGEVEGFDRVVFQSSLQGVLLRERFRARAIARCRLERTSSTRAVTLLSSPGPQTKSTWGIFSKIPSGSRSAMHPMTPTIMAGRLALVARSEPRREHLLFGVIADRTGVQQHEVGGFHALDRLVTQHAKLSENQLAVEHVHLAAHGFEID